jgi:beta-xylosidase
MKKIIVLGLCLNLLIVFGCATRSDSAAASSTRSRYLYLDDYAADPAAHVFNGKLYIYPSHDRRTNAGSSGPFPYDAPQYDMADYHVFSIDDVLNGDITDHGEVLNVKDIPWAVGQLWDNDVAHKNGAYYMYFPAKGSDNIFRIGVAVAERPEGPFVPQNTPITGSYSIDPCVFEDNGNYYLYFGGLWGGQLQRYKNNNYTGTDSFPSNNEPAIPPRVAKISDDMLRFAEDPRPVVILDTNGSPIKAGNNSRRFFEASWMHKKNDTYYFSWSTGDTHLLCYATGDNPYGPFTYQGVLLTPVTGWTTHHSIVEYKGKWYLFYHDSRRSGIDHLRHMKVIELKYLPDGKIKTIDGWK